MDYEAINYNNRNEALAAFRKMIERKKAMGRENWERVWAISFIQTTACKVSKVVAEKIENYAAIIVQRSNHKLEKIIVDFDNFVGFFQNKPQ